MAAVHLFRSHTRAGSSRSEGIAEVRMPLPKLVNLILGQRLAVIPLSGITSLILPTATYPHVDSGEQSHSLECDAGGNSRDVIRAILLREHQSGDDASDLATANSEGGDSASLDVTNDLVDTGKLVNDNLFSKVVRVRLTTTQ